MSVEALQFALSALKNTYWPYIGRAIGNSASGPLFDLIDPACLNLPTSLKEFQQRTKQNLIRFHAVYVVIITFGLVANHWHVAAVATFLHRLGISSTSLSRADAPPNTRVYRNGSLKYTHHLMRGMWVSLSLWSLRSIMSTTLQFAMICTVHAALLDAKTRPPAKQSS
ncbi:uncharacterized protein CCOS01_17113 [Colletotrichum costaricense]|uniref:Uncharacterized protein n=1 Tax=Colletotrichum costaricense TaxID=1209916 RepID=A0AAI9YE74_9PEZI|nr:uncharacterized protein CCOS01_17113 [Colletotrichum costaricense]KAK1502285.1 hypothetical protein CCOS01_17113 [Colletotrichum costaricense]